MLSTTTQTAAQTLSFFTSNNLPIDQRAQLTTYNRSHPPWEGPRLRPRRRQRDGGRASRRRRRPAPRRRAGSESRRASSGCTGRPAPKRGVRGPSPRWRRASSAALASGVLRRGAASFFRVFLRTTAWRFAVTAAFDVDATNVADAAFWRRRRRRRRRRRGLGGGARRFGDRVIESSSSTRCVCHQTSPIVGRRLRSRQRAPLDRRPAFAASSAISPRLMSGGAAQRFGWGLRAGALYLTPVMAASSLISASSSPM